MPKYVPKHCSKSTHEHDLNEGEYKGFNRDGIEGVFHTKLHAVAQSKVCDYMDHAYHSANEN